MPTPYELFDDLCGQLDQRFTRFTGPNAPWTNLLLEHFKAQAELYGLRGDDLILPGRNGAAKRGLRWVDGNAEVVALAWHWQRNVAVWNLDVLKALLLRDARLKVFLTDTRADLADKRREQVVALLASVGRTKHNGDVLVVILAPGGRATSDPMANATMIVWGSSERGVSRAK